MGSVVDSESIVEVRRQWNGWRGARYRLSDIDKLRWDNVSGGVHARAPQLYVHGYVLCDRMIDGEVDHSCLHGTAPHRIKICITKKGNEAVWKKIIEIVGPRPERARPVPKTGGDRNVGN